MSIRSLLSSLALELSAFMLESRCMLHVACCFQLAKDTVVNIWKANPDPSAEMAKVTGKGYQSITSACWYLNRVAYGENWQSYYACDPQVSTYSLFFTPSISLVAALVKCRGQRLESNWRPNGSTGSCVHHRCRLQSYHVSVLVFECD